MPPGNHASNESDERWALAQRVAAAPGFRKSARLRDFLLYVCERSIAGRIEEISEQQIGIHVFGRPATYDPGEDNVVRSQARLLRQKLEEHFEDEGREETLVIAIPKGTYVPVFEQRAERRAAPPATGQQPPLVRVLSVLVVLLAAACLWLGISLRRGDGPAQPHQTEAFAQLWNAIYPRDRQTYVVTPDLTHVLLQSASGQTISGAEYFASGYPELARKMAAGAGLEKLLPHFAELRLTTLDGLSALFQVPQAAQERIVLRSARQLSGRDFLDTSVVLIGGRKANPWAELFDEKLSLRCEWDLAGGGGLCRNLTPRAGESALYEPAGEGKQRVSYASVAYVPTPNRRGVALLVAGDPPLGLAFIARESQAGSFLEGLKSQSGTERLPFFEVLVRGRGGNGQNAAADLVAVRRLPD